MKRFFKWLNGWVLGHDMLAPPEAGTVFDRSDVIIRLKGRGRSIDGFLVYECVYSYKQPWWVFKKPCRHPAFIIDGHDDFIHARTYREATIKLRVLRRKKRNEQRLAKGGK